MFWHFNAFFPSWVFILLPDQIVIKCPPTTTLPGTCPKIWTFQNILFKCPQRRSTVGVVAQHRSNILYQALICANQYGAAPKFTHIMFIYMGQDLKKSKMALIPSLLSLLNSSLGLQFNWFTWKDLVKQHMEEMTNLYRTTTLAVSVILSCSIVAFVFHIPHSPVSL